MSVRTKIRIGMAIGAALFVLWVLYLARSALVPFFVGAIFAYLLAPLVDRLSLRLPFSQRWPGVARGIIIVLLYAVAGTILTMSALLIVPGVSREIGDFVNDSPTYFEGARSQVEEWSHFYDDLPPDVRRQVDDVVNRVGGMLGQVIQGLAERTLGFATATFSILIGFFAVPFWLFYVLKDQQRGSAWFYNAFPKQIRQDTRAIVTIVNHVLGSYIRAQLLLGLTVGLVTVVGLLILDVPFAIALGVIAGITELIPVLGPIVAAMIAGTVTLAAEPSLTPWVLLFFFLVQQVENSLLVPRIQGHAVEMHPAAIILLLVIAGQLFGVWGMIVAVPLAAVARDIFIYIYRRLDDETIPEAIAEVEEGQEPDEVAKVTRDATRVDPPITRPDVSVS